MIFLSFIYLAAEFRRLCNRCHAFSTYPHHIFILSLTLNCDKIASWHFLTKQVLYTRYRQTRTKKRVPLQWMTWYAALFWISNVLCAFIHLTKSNIKKTFVKRRMSQANQRHIVAEIRQSVHVHYRQCLRLLSYSCFCFV